MIQLSLSEWRILKAFENEEHCDVRITLAIGTLMCAHSLVMVLSYPINWKSEQSEGKP